MPNYTRRPLKRQRSQPQSYWAGSRSTQSVPERAILTEDGEPILLEGGGVMITES